MGVLIPFIVFSQVMPTPVQSDLEIISQTDGAQSSRVPISLSYDPYRAVKQSYLVDTDIEYGPLGDLRETEILQPLPSTPLLEAPLETKEFEASEPSDNRITTPHSTAPSDSTTLLSPDHPLAQTSPISTRASHYYKAIALSPSSFYKRYRSSYETPSPSSSLTLPIRKRYRGTSELVKDTKDESLDLDTKREGSKDEGPSSEDGGHGSEDEGIGSEEEAASEGQQQAVLVVDTAADEPLGLGYGASRRRELALGKGSVHSTSPSPSSYLTLPIRKRYRGTSEHVEDTKDESSDLDTEREGSEHEGPGLEDGGHGSEDERLGSDEEAASEGQQQAVLVVDTAVDEPLGLGYGALRRRELALGEGSVHSTSEIGKSSRSMSEQQRVEETPTPKPQSSSSLPISPSSLVASLVTTPAATIAVGKDEFLKVGVQLEVQESILLDHTQRLDALPPTLFKGYDRDIRELYTRSREEEDIRKRWGEYFSSLFNKNPFNESRADVGRAVGSSSLHIHYECYYSRINQGEVKTGLKKMGRYKAIFSSAKILDEWRLSEVIPIYKNKGDAQACSNYRGIKLRSHTTKLWERVIDRRLRRETKVSENQSGFMLGRSTTEAIHLLRSLIEKYSEKQRDFHMAFLDLEKAYDSVPRELVWKTLIDKGTLRRYSRVIKDMYEVAKTRVRTTVGNTDFFPVEVGLHQGSAISPYLFTLILDELSRGI
uniref:Retrovirus-related Pol polyprotein LINE-1 n=1 Tax=Tanacetum cinerariifolium TaxID=118510 RepID=A0A699I837_TANCI|nr:retrovirus-related Pol polyprotein LINE-1 [Tanacetum cinerariifolium]